MRVSIQKGIKATSPVSLRALLTAELVQLLKDEIEYLRVELRKRDEWIERMMPMLPSPHRSWWARLLGR